MARKNRIFVSFAAEDANCRDLLKGQAKNGASPFDFVDMSVKEPWDSQWKTNCRTKIKGCDGLIALLSKKMASADGARWEMKAAAEEGVPRLGIHISKDAKGAVPSELGTSPVIEWTWDGIAKWLNKL
jgi:hypothetical protein